MKKIKSMEYVLSLGAFILLFSGIALVFNDSFSSVLVKVLGMSLLTIFLMILSIVSQKVLKVENAARISFYLSFISLIISYVLMGCNSVFGNWFSINGDGVQVFLASIAVLVALLAIITAIKYKNYSFIHITFVCILVAVFHLFTFFNLDFQIILLVIGSVLLLLNIFKVNKLIYEFVSVAVYIFALISVLFGYSNSFLLSSIILVINLISIMIALFRYKDLENELLSIIILGISVITFIESSFDIFNTGVVIVVTSFIICLLDLFVNCFKILNKKYVKIIFKAFINIVFLYLIATGINGYELPLLVLSIFMIVTSFINSFVIKNYDYEEALFPFKLLLTFMIIFNYVLSFVEINYLYFYVVTSFVFVTLYKMTKSNVHRAEYMIINILCLLLLIVSDFTNLFLEYLVVILTLFINYLIVAYKKTASEYNIYYTAILIMMMIASSYLGKGATSLVILGIILGVSLVINFKNKYNFCITFPAMFYVIYMYISGVIENVDYYIIVMSSLYFILLSIASEVIFSRYKDKDIFISLTFILGLLNLLSSTYGFIVNLYSLIISLILIFISLKNKHYKILYYVGLIFSIINLLCLLRFLDGLPTAVYLLIIGMVIVIVVSIMIYKYQNREIKEEAINKQISNNNSSSVKEEKIVSYEINYCGVCGNRLSKEENFCGNCGKRLK